MSKKEIAKRIKEIWQFGSGERKDVSLKHIDFDNMTFVMKVGNCDSIAIDFPEEIKRQIKIDKLLGDSSDI